MDPSSMWCLALQWSPASVWWASPRTSWHEEDGAGEEGKNLVSYWQPWTTEVTDSYYLQIIRIPPTPSNFHIYGLHLLCLLIFTTDEDYNYEKFKIREYTNISSTTQESKDIMIISCNLPGNSTIQFWENEYKRQVTSQHYWNNNFDITDPLTKSGIPRGAWT